MKTHVDIEIIGLDQRTKTYRFEAYRQARLLDINGFVKFKSPTIITISAEGEMEKVYEYLAWCQQNFITQKTKMLTETNDKLMNYNEFRIVEC